MSEPAMSIRMTVYVTMCVRYNRPSNVQVFTDRDAALQQHTYNETMCKIDRRGTAHMHEEIVEYEYVTMNAYKSQSHSLRAYRRQMRAMRPLREKING